METNLEKFVPYTHAVLLKVLGFNEPTFARYRRKTFQFQTLGKPYDYNSSPIVDGDISAPIWSDVIDWFEVRFNLEGNIKSFKEGGEVTWLHSVQELGKVSNYRIEMSTKSDAKLKCLDKLIELGKDRLVNELKLNVTQLLNSIYHDVIDSSRLKGLKDKVREVLNQLTIINTTFTVDNLTDYIKDIETILKNKNIK